MIAKLTKKEEIEIIRKRVTTQVTSGGNGIGSYGNYYEVVDPQKLAEYLSELK